MGFSGVMWILLSADMSVVLLFEWVIEPNSSSFPGQHPVCSGGIQPADWGQREEGEGPPVPLGRGGGGESRAQRLPQAADHADVSGKEEATNHSCCYSFTVCWAVKITLRQAVFNVKTICSQDALIGLLIHHCLLSTPQNPHAGSTGSDSGPSLRELPLRPPQAGWQVVLPRLHSASVSCVRTCLSACFSAPPPPQTANLD